MLTSVLANAALEVQIQANPDPARPGDVIMVEITIGNTDVAARSDVVMTMEYPAGLADLGHDSIESGVCDGSVTTSLSECEPTELIIWTLGTLPAGETVTVTMPPQVAGSTAAGTVIPFDAEVTDSSATIVNASASVGVVAGRALEVVLTEVDPEPVQAGAEITYQLSFGHTATSVAATNSVLDLNVPSGLTYVSATDGGSLSGSTVSWALGTLLPGEVGERRATFTVDPGAQNGSSFKVDALLNDDNGQPTLVEELTIVEAADALQLAMDFNPNPGRPNDLLDGHLTVSNTGFVDRSDVVVTMRYPIGLADLRHVSIQGGACDGSVTTSLSECEPTEFVRWALGTVPAGESVTVTLPPRIAASTRQGPSSNSTPGRRTAPTRWRSPRKPSRSSMTVGSSWRCPRSSRNRCRPAMS